MMRAAWSLLKVPDDSVYPGARDDWLFSLMVVVAPDDEESITHCDLVKHLHERLHARAEGGELICRGTRLCVDPFSNLLQFTVGVLIFDELFSCRQNEIVRG